MKPLDLLFVDDCPGPYAVYDRNLSAPSYIFEDGQVKTIVLGKTLKIRTKPATDEELNRGVVLMIQAAGRDSIEVACPRAMYVKVRKYFDDADLMLSSVLVHPGTVAPEFLYVFGVPVLESELLTPGTIYVVTDPEYLGRVTRHGEDRAVSLFNSPGVLALRPRAD